MNVLTSSVSTGSNFPRGVVSPIVKKGKAEKFSPFYLDISFICFIFTSH